MCGNVMHAYIVSKVKKNIFELNFSNYLIEGTSNSVLVAMYILACTLHQSKLLSLSVFIFLHLCRSYDVGHDVVSFTCTYLIYTHLYLMSTSPIKCSTFQA